MSFHIRPATTADRDSLDALLGASYGTLLAADYPKSVLQKALPIIAVSRHELLECGTFYVACHDDGVPIACGGWTRSAPSGALTQDDTSGHVRHFATHPDSLRQGIAGAILDHCMAEAGNAGLEHLACLSTLTAVPFYSHYHFVALRKFDLALAPGIRFPSVEMTRRIH